MNSANVDPRLKKSARRYWKMVNDLKPDASWGEQSESLIYLRALYSEFGMRASRAAIDEVKRESSADTEVEK